MGTNFKNDSRVSNSIRNLKIAWICQLCMIILKFVTRRLFTQSIPDEYLGLENLYVNIIGMLNLAELGVGAAVGYELYKPLAEHDEECVAAIMRYMAVIFKRISLVIFVLGVCLIPFLHFFAPEISELRSAYLVYLFYVVSTVVGYLFGYKSVLCSADQKNYIYTRNHYFFALSMNLVQAFVLCAFRSYLIYAFIQFVFCVVEGKCLSHVMNKEYPILGRKDVYKIAPETQHKIWGDVKYIAIGNIGNQVINSTDSIVITKLLGLVSNGIYGNYTLITSATATILDQVLWAMNASVGNLVVKEDEGKQIQIFWQLLFIQVSIYTVASACFYNIVQPFIAYWLGSSYLLDISTVICIVVSFYIRGCRIVVNTFRKAYGLFSLDAKKSCIEAAINLGLSVVLAYYYGVKGVVVGTIVSALLVGVWLEIYNLNQYMHFGVVRYFNKWITYIVVGSFVIGMSSYLCNKLSMHWYIRIPFSGLISVAIFIVAWSLIFYRRKEFKDTYDIFAGVLRRLIKHV